MALSLRERCQKRLEGLKKTRQPYEEEYREIASLAQPAKSRWLSTDTNKNVRQRNRRLNSSHGIFAFRTLQGGMTSGLSSPSRPWMRFGLHDEELADAPDVRAWLDEVEKRMYGFLAATNFYAAVKSGYLELGMFGTEACVMVEHPTEGAVCHQLTAGEYWIGLGSALTPEALYRRCPLTVVQVMQRFERSRISPRIIAAYDRSNYDEVCDIYQGIEINDDFDESYAGTKGKKYRSVYWDADHGTQETLSIGGFEEQPFWAPRWETTGGDAYGSGPGHDALPDLRELQLQSKRKGEATDYALWPEIITPAKVKLKRQPKSVVSAALLDAEKVIVPYTVPYQTIGVIAEDVNRCEEQIDRATFADLFMAITTMPGVQPRNIEEIAARNEEKLTQLGPVIERVNNEKLEVAIDRTFGIMSRLGLLPPAPDAVREAGGQLQTEFVSILTQMQRMVGLGQIERAVGFVGNLAGLFPEVRHKVDAMEIVDEYWDRAGAPSKTIRPTDEAEQRAAAEQQAAQAAQAAEAARKAAPAGQVAVNAAELMAQTNQGGLPMAGAMPL